MGEGQSRPRPRAPLVVPKQPVGQVKPRPQYTEKVIKSTIDTVVVTPQRKMQDRSNAQLQPTTLQPNTTLQPTIVQSFIGGYFIGGPEDADLCPQGIILLLFFIIIISVAIALSSYLSCAENMNRISE